MKTYYLLRSNSKDSRICLRLLHDKEIDVIKYAHKEIESAKWDSQEKRARGRSAEIKVLNSYLDNLEAHVKKEFQRDFENGIKINTTWLGNKILGFNSQDANQDEYLLTTWFDRYIENLNYGSEGEDSVDKSFRTIQKYQSIRGKIESFEKDKKGSVYLGDIDRQWRIDFIDFLRKGNISENTIGRYLTFIKTVFRTAVDEKKADPTQVKHLKGYSKKAQIITLSFEEINVLRQSRFLDLTMEAVKDWLIIGCYTGQRISDLLNMTSKKFVNYGGITLVELKQMKTGKVVQIPIHPIVKEVLEKRNNEFPPVQGVSHGSKSAIFNRKAKLVCKNAGLTQKVTGSLKNEITKKLEVGEFEKWKLVTSHICRRSFASNFYGNEKYPTPLLMNITGHATEKQFLEYIGKPSSDFSLQLADKWKDEKIEVVTNIKNIG
jgi:integrase